MVLYNEGTPESTVPAHSRDQIPPPDEDAEIAFLEDVVAATLEAQDRRGALEEYRVEQKPEGDIHHIRYRYSPTESATTTLQRLIATGNIMITHYYPGGVPPNSVELHPI